MTKKITLVFLLALCGVAANAQNTKEDSLNNNSLVSFLQGTTIGGYGEANYILNTNYGTANTDLARVVLFLGHKFSNKISFFSELEIEDAKVSGGENGGEVSYEQAYLKFNLNRNNNIIAGLFIPRIGIINENHLPTSFNSVERPLVETFIIPATWRELGIGYNGTISQLGGLQYTVAVVNGLNSAGFTAGTGLQGGRFEGRNASAQNIAVTGSLLYSVAGLRVQVSGYYGGSAGIANRQADSLRLNNGPFGTPVALEEADAQYHFKGFYAIALGTIVQIPDAANINAAYANNVPEQMTGAYGELGFDFLHSKHNGRALTLFARYEDYNMNSEVPDNGIENGQWNQQHIITGISYKPTRGVIVKLDFHYQKTGNINPALILNPYTNAPAYEPQQNFVEAGVGYSF